MNRSEAISLFRASRLPLAQARTDAPEVAALVERAATAERTVVVERLHASLPEAAAKALREVDLRSVPAGGLSSALRERLSALVPQPGIPAATVSQPDASAEPDTATLPDDATRLADLQDPLPDDDTRLDDIAFLRPGIDLGRFYVLADAVKLAPERAEALAKTLPSPEAATDEVLADLVKKQTLKAEEAQSLGATRVAFLLSDDTEVLTRAVAGKARFRLGLQPRAAHRRRHRGWFRD